MSYRDLKYVSKGVFGEVFRAKNKRGEDVILKSMDEVDHKYFKNEILVLKKLRSLERPFVPCFNDEFSTIMNGKKKYIIVMDVVDGRDLKMIVDSRQDPIGPEDLWRLFLQILLGIKFIHSRGIVHNDLKLNNIMLDRYNDVKFIDFGHSCSGPRRKVGMSLMTGMSLLTGTVTQRATYGTLTNVDDEGITECNFDFFGNNFPPPEMKDNNIPLKESDHEKFIYGRDVWSLSLIFFYIANGKYPFNTDLIGKDNMYEKLDKSRYPLDDGRTDGFINFMLKRDWKERPSVDECIENLNYHVLSKKLRPEKTLARYKTMAG